jgi:hypothetical protein
LKNKFLEIFIMNRREFVVTAATAATAAVLPSFVAISFDPSDEIVTTESHDHRLLVVQRGQKIQINDGYIDMWSSPYPIPLPGTQTKIGGEIFEITQAPENHSDNVMFISVTKVE